MLQDLIKFLSFVIRQKNSLSNLAIFSIRENKTRQIQHFFQFAKLNPHKIFHFGYSPNLIPTKINPIKVIFFGKFVPILQSLK